jgi:hypothetical protein
MRGTLLTFQLTGVRAPHATISSTTAITTATSSSSVDPNDPYSTGRGSRDGYYSNKSSEQTANDTVGLCTEGPSYLLSFWGEVEVRTCSFDLKLHLKFTDCNRPLAAAAAGIAMMFH